MRETFILRDGGLVPKPPATGPKIIPDRMKTSPAGRAAIRQREGCRLVAYQDTKGVWTIGVGHTGPVDGGPVRKGMRITLQKADDLLAADLAQVEAVINSAVTAVLVFQSQFDAMASLAFNIGVNGFRNSTVVRKLNAGDVQGAADAFLLWNKPPELKGRREAERLQFLSPISAPIATTTPPTFWQRMAALFGFVA